MRMVALFVVAVFALTGIVVIARARGQTHHFDLRRGALTIASRPALALLGTTQEVVRRPLASLQDVVLENGGTVGGDHSVGRTYRLAYVFADGARHPLRPYYTTGRAGYVALQERMRAVIERMRRS